MIRILCPHCDRRFRTERRVIGQTAVCTGCGESFKIGEKLAPFEWEQKALVEDSWLGVEPPEEKPELKHCVMCEAPMTEGEVVCAACGANQVTGVVHRPKVEPKSEPTAMWDSIPWRGLAILGVVLLLGYGAYRGIVALTHSVVETGEQMVAEGPIYQAAAFLRDSGDEYAFRRRYVGLVDDDNLEHALRRLTVDDAVMRRAGELLIAVGKIDNPLPVLEQAAEQDKGSLLEAIGPRRLLEWTNHRDPAVRMRSARALLGMCGLTQDDEKLAALSEPGSYEDKQKRLNDLCRYWPLLVGDFRAAIDHKVSSTVLHIEQVGNVFYLTSSQGDFRWRSDRNQEFTMPIEYWCLATGAAVDVEEARGLLEGEMLIRSPMGAHWQGRATVTAKRHWLGTLPGFLPIDTPPVGETVEIGLELRRP